MINYKLKHGLDDWDKWKEIPAIDLPADPSAQTFVLENTLENAQENEKVIQSWKKIAILKATAETPTDFFIGFSNEGITLFLDHELKTDLVYGMRIGPEPVKVFAFPKDLKTQIQLELVEITHEDDPKHVETILI